MKKTFELWIGRIDLRKFYQVWLEKDEHHKEAWWSDWWICWDEDCWCWELEEYKRDYPNWKYILVPWYKRCMTLYNSWDRLLIRICYIIIWIIIWILI